MEVDDQFASELRGAIKSDEATLRLSHVSFIYKYINTHSNTNNFNIYTEIICISIYS